MRRTCVQRQNIGQRYEKTTQSKAIVVKENTIVVRTILLLFNANFLADTGEFPILCVCERYNLVILSKTGRYCETF